MKIVRDVWNFVKSEEALMLIKIAATVFTLANTIDMYNRSRRKVGFVQPKSNTKKIGF